MSLTECLKAQLLFACMVGKFGRLFIESDSL